jgi:hypothetical protein
VCTSTCRACAFSYFILLWHLPYKFLLIVTCCSFQSLLIKEVYPGDYRRELWSQQTSVLTYLSLLAVVTPLSFRVFIYYETRKIREGTSQHACTLKESRRWRKLAYFTQCFLPGVNSFFSLAVTSSASAFALKRDWKFYRKDGNQIQLKPTSKLVKRVLWIWNQCSEPRYAAQQVRKTIWVALFESVILPVQRKCFYHKSF